MIDSGVVHIFRNASGGVHGLSQALFSILVEDVGKSVTAEERGRGQKPKIMLRNI